MIPWFRYLTKKTPMIQISDINSKKYVVISRSQREIPLTGLKYSYTCIMFKIHIPFSILRSQKFYLTWWFPFSILKTEWDGNVSASPFSILNMLIRKPSKIKLRMENGEWKQMLTRALPRKDKKLMQIVTNWEWRMGNYKTMCFERFLRMENENMLLCNLRQSHENGEWECVHKCNFSEWRMGLGKNKH